MKIAIIGSKGVPAKYGGVQTVVEHVAVGLAELGHDITIYGRQYYTAPLPKRYVYKNVRVINVRGINTKRLDTISHCLISSVFVCFKEYDVIAYHSIVPAYFAFLPKLFGKKIVLHSHGLINTISKWSINEKSLANKLARMSAQFIDIITTVSIAEAVKTSDLFSKQAIVIPNGLAYKDMLKPVQPRKYILYVGRIVEGKGLEVLINAFNLLVKNNLVRDYELLIIGSPVHASGYYRSLQEISKNNSHIKWLGPIYGEDLIDYYHYAYCVVVPSESESFGLTVLDALAYNGCVICSEIEQFKMLFFDYVCYFKQNDVYSLYRKLELILGNSSLRWRFVNRSNSFDFSVYHWDRIVLEYQKVYTSLLTA